MSDRDIDINLTGSTDKAVTSENTISPEEFKRRMARVLDRGWAVDRLHVDLPPDIHGEWIPVDPASIARAEMLGFSVDNKYAVNRKLNDAGDNGARVGDVVFMVQPMWMHQMIEQKRTEEYKRAHLSPKQKEEQDYEAQVKHKLDMPANINSEASVVKGPEITEALLNQKS